MTNSMSNQLKFTLIRLLSRKFLLCLLTLMCSTYLVINSNITDQVYSTIILATVAVYVAGNVTQKMKAEKNE